VKKSQLKILIKLVGFGNSSEKRGIKKENKRFYKVFILKLQINFVGAS